MIDGAGIGTIQGGIAASSVCPTTEFTDAWIEGLALDVLASMTGEGCAHLYPEEKFVESFVASFKMALCLRESKL